MYYLAPFIDHVVCPGTDFFSVSFPLFSFSYTLVSFEADNRFKFWKGIVESDATIKLWRQSLFLSRYYYQIDRLYNTLYFLHVIFTLFPFVRLQNVPEMFSISPYTLFHNNGIFLSYLWNNLHTKYVEN